MAEAGCPADHLHMQRALALAKQGQGYVEPNPLVGCVLVQAGQVVGEGFHAQFGGPHAEIVALQAAGAAARGATAYVTLEPCCHHGKTPPCVEALITAGISQVVVGVLDPFEKVAGKGVQALQAAGIAVRWGICADEASRLIAPHTMRCRSGRPWIVAKWAMSWDGKIGTHSGESQWISGPEAAHVTHAIRGRMDGILVGIGTALADNPLLTARPPGPRVAQRIVLDSMARLPLTSQLVQTAREFPTCVVVGPQAASTRCTELEQAGCQVLSFPETDASARLKRYLHQAAVQGMTNVLVEGGSQVLGSLFSERHIDEVHVLIGPKLIGGASAPGPIGGHGIQCLADAFRLHQMQYQTLGPDLYLTGLIDHNNGHLTPGPIVPGSADPATHPFT